MPSSSKYRGYPRRSKNYYASKIQAAARRRAAVRRSKSVPTRSLTKMIKNVSLKNSETKRSSDYFQGQDLFHNKTVYHGGLINVKVGTGNPDGLNTRDGSGFQGSRIGNEIICRGIAFKFYLERLSGGANSHFRICVFKYRQGATLDDAYFWQAGAGDGQNDILRINDSIDTSEIKVLKHLTIRPSGHGWYTGNVDFYVLLKNWKVKFSTGTSGQPEHYNIGFAVVAVDKHNTPVTTHIADLNYAWKLFYKDP